VDRRTLLAFSLIGAITVAFILVSQKMQAPRDTQAPAASVPTTTLPPAVQPEEQLPAPVVQPSTEAKLEEAIHVGMGELLRYDLTWSNRGGCLTSARLTDYPAEIGKTEGVLLLSAAETGECTLGITDPAGLLPLEKAIYDVKREGDVLTFTASFENGLKVSKEFQFTPGKYDIGVKLKFENTSETPLPLQYILWGAARIVPERSGDAAPMGAIGWRAKNGGVGITTKTAAKVRKLEYDTLNDPRGPILWAGAENRYFAAVIEPVVPQGAAGESGTVKSVQIRYLPQSDETVTQWGGKAKLDNVAVSLLTEQRTIPAHGVIADDYRYFLGPKEQKVLKEYPNLPGLLDYGVFAFISRPLLLLLNLFYRIIPNYGVGIILMTILVKVALFPLTRKGQIAMHKMQRLQPHVKSLQEKYKDDKQRQGREMMELYRRHNANPMSGCMPMLLQIPIFFGLYRMLGSSIGLRQQGFVSWISDLAQPDTITYMSGWPINVLPVLMVISWVVQQMTMPKPADPQQAQTQKMMMFMPIVFGFMLYGMASGLTLYWLTSTFLGILEQRLIKHQIRHMETSGHFDVKEVVEAPSRPKRSK